MLGLNVSEDSATFWRSNLRRGVFLSHPNGAAPLCALLSMLPQGDPTPLATLSWPEERVEQIRAATMTGPTSNNVFYATGTTTSSGSTVTPTAGTTYRIYIASAETIYQTDDIFRIQKLPLAAGGKASVNFRVVSTGTNYVEAIAQNTVGAVTNNAAAIVGVMTIHQGSAFAEGSRSRSGNSYYPTRIANNTQVFKDAFSLTRHALKAPLEYNQSSDYQRQLKRAGMKHMMGIEESLLFGEKTEALAADANGEGVNVRRTTMGGLAYYLRQWELGNTTNGGAFSYRTGIDLTAQTDFLTYPDKRIIKLSDATISMDSFVEMEALPFKKTNSSAQEKLCLCGSGYMSKINARYSKEFVNVKAPAEQFEKWAFKIVARETPNGTIYYKTHPLFSNPDHPMYNGAFYLDLGFISLVPFIDQDTEVQQNIQANDVDYRKDQYMTELSAEFVFPESHLMVQDLGGITL